MRRVYFTRVSTQLVFVIGIKQQPLQQLVTCHVKMTVSLGPPGTLVTGNKTKPVTMKSISETCVVNLRLDVLTNGPRCGAHRSVLVTGFYGARYFVGMFVTVFQLKPITQWAAFVTSFNYTRYRYVGHPNSKVLPACRLHTGTSQDFAAIRGCILEPGRIWLNSQKLDLSSNFTKIHNSHASYDKIQHHRLTRRKCISQGGMQKFPSHHT
jgi:hypothetical protein